MTRDVSNPAQRLSSPTFSPLYRQIKDFLTRSLEEGEWGPGDAIPSEGELAARFNVSQGTVRKAIDEMAAENMLVRRQGKGTFVATHSDPRSFYRFLRLVPDDSKAAPAVSDPFFCETIDASPEVATVLGLRAGGKVVHVKRLLRFSGEPVVFDQIYLVADLFNGLTLEGLRAGERSLYSLFESDFGVRMIHAEEHLRAVGADAQSAGIIGVPVGEPLLLVERTAYTYGNKPVEWRRGLYYTRQHYYRNDLG
ncbi:MAG: GntR family transcriptional regulator [Gammaproteobacteria bacterium]|nr:GntR family transcriptional regulator [Gammaproteobacteria bacterium]MBU1601829.1 GntR family transcriptional regulator [Gammaproteobacteria bacterium]MBU2432201.1 GntR family transcriptional regulator [Gammaproteobacteria bacterium]MBU2450406.1 GntR family transcriptional regulator [Gammaproteobacteria bacterium]